MIPAECQSERTPLEVALEFVDRINRRSPDAIAELMTDDHLFIDSLGQARSGRERMRDSWARYLSMFPDYAVEVERTLTGGNVVALLGRAGGTYAPDGVLREEGRWDVPAAWRAVVRGGLIAEWHVYADNSPVLRIIERVGGESGQG